MIDVVLQERFVANVAAAFFWILSLAVPDVDRFTVFSMQIGDVHRSLATRISETKDGDGSLKV